MPVTPHTVINFQQVCRDRDIFFELGAVKNDK